MLCFNERVLDLWKISRKKFTFYSDAIYHIYYNTIFSRIDRGLKFIEIFQLYIITESSAFKYLLIIRHMDFLKKGLASLAISAIAVVSSASATFTDQAEIPSWADEAIEELIDQGVISGNDDGSFAPNRQLNRAEVSKIIVLATGIDIDTTGGPHFPDVSEDAWYYDYIETMYNQGWINGYPDGKFRPGVGINRAEIAKMVVNAFEIEQDLSGAGHFDDVAESDWFYGYVETVYNSGLMRGYGDGSFGPSNAVTRAETAKIVYDSQLIVLAPTGPSEGTLEVVLSGDTPRGTNIPFNATSVPFTTIEMTAADDSDVEVSALTFTRLGLGDNDDFDNVWLEIDGFKVGNDKSINNDDVVELRFNPPIVVPAGQTLVADVVASLKYSANDKNTGHHNRLALVSFDDVVSSASNIAGDFPIEGEEMEVANYEVSQLKFSTLGADATIDVGDNFIEVGKFRMLNTSNSNKDIELRAITFKNDGSAELEDDLENVSLYVSGEQVSAETILDGDYVTFRLDNGVTGGYILEDGDSKIFSIRADIVSAEKNDSINFKIDNFEDVVGVEIGTAFGVKAVSGNSGYVGKNAEDSAATLKTYTIESGDLNISRDPASLGNQEYAPGSNDVVFLTARLVVDQPLIVDGVVIDVADATSGMTVANANDYFDNFRLYLNDKLIDTENEFTAGGSSSSAVDAKLNFSTTFEIAGTSILKLVGNVQDDAPTGNFIKFELTRTAFDSPEYISTGDQVEAEDIIGNAVASKVEVQESLLTIARTDGFGTTETVVAGVNDITFLKYVLDNNNSGDVNVSSVSIKALGKGGATTYSNFTAAIFVDGTQQGSSKNLTTTGTATFNDLSVVIPSAGQKEFEVVVDTIESAASDDLASSAIASQSAPMAITAAVPAGQNYIDVADGTKFEAKAGAGTSPLPGNADYRGDQIAVSVDGSSLGDNAEVKTIVAIDGNRLLFGTGAAAKVDAVAEVTTIKVTTAPDTDGDAIVNLNGTDHAVALLAADGVNEAAIKIKNVVDALADYSATVSGDTVTITAATAGAQTDATFAGGPTNAAATVTVTTQGSDEVAQNTGTGNAFVNSHAITEKVTNQSETVALPAAGASKTGIKLTNVDKISVGDVLTINAKKYKVTALNTTAVTVDVKGEAGVVAQNVSVGTAVTEDATTGGSKLQIQVTGVDADNVENGQKVVVKKSGNELAVCTDTAPAAALSGNCVYSAQFSLIKSGDLTATLGQTVDGTILLANQTNAEVLKIQFQAANDEIQVKDLYLKASNNRAGERVSFKLFGPSGQLIQTKQMIDNSLHFELANQDRIRVAKDETTTVTIKIDVRDITEADQTGVVLKLDLDETKGTDGVEAVTAATGSDLAAAKINGASNTANVDGQEFVLYRTAMTVTHASSQPTISDPNANNQEFYRFSVTADQARQIELGELNFAVALSGMKFDAGVTDNQVEVKKVKDDGQVDNTSAVATATFVADPSGGKTANVNVIFNNQQIDAGQTTTYALLIGKTVQDGTAADDDAVSVDITTDTGYAAPAKRSDAVTASNIVWSDKSSTAHSDDTLDWLNGYKITTSTTPQVNND